VNFLTTGYRTYFDIRIIELSKYDQKNDNIYDLQLPFVEANVSK
jgi:hypothetical protein